MTENGSKIDPKSVPKSIKKHAKNRSKKYGQNFEKNVGRSGQNSKPGHLVNGPGRMRAILVKARRNVRGRRGGKEGLKPLRVWQGSWARSLDPGIWGLEIWDLAKPDRNPFYSLARRAPPLQGGRRKARARIPLGQFMGFVGLWLVGVFVCGFATK